MPPRTQHVQQLMQQRIAALEGKLDEVESERHPVFGLRMPRACPGVDPRMLNPRNVWSDTAAYDAAAMRLRDMFRANFEKNHFGNFGIDSLM